MMKNREKISNKIILFIVLFVFLMGLAYLYSIGIVSNKDVDNIIIDHSSSILGWIDIAPSTNYDLRFFLNQNPFGIDKSIQIPMFPYENPFYMILVEDGENHSVFFQQILEPYIKNKFHEIYFFSKDISAVLHKVDEKSELTGKPCVYIVLTSGNKDFQLYDILLPKFPVFLFEANPSEEENKNILMLISKATGGRIFSQNNHESLKELNLFLQSPLKNQRIIFSFHLTFFRRFLPNKLEILSNGLIQEFDIGISKNYLHWIEVFQQLTLFFLLITGLSIFIPFFFRTRKKWRIRKLKEAKQKALKKFHIGWIEFISIDHSSVRITKSKFTIGSAESCDLVLMDPSISSHHCQIIDVEHGFYIEDLKSRLGTLINEKPVQRLPLNDMDQIRIGSIILIFHKSALQYVSDEKVL